MAEDLKDNWKKVGKDFTSFGAGLGKSLLNTMKTGVNAATKWARDDENPEAKAEEPKAEEPKAEEVKAEEPKAEEAKTEEPKAEA
jgi:hypothetical protein